MLDPTQHPPPSGATRGAPTDCVPGDREAGRRERAEALRAKVGKEVREARRLSRDASLPRQRVGPSGPRAWRSPFIRAYGRCGNISAAAAHVGVTPKTVYQTIQRDPALRPALDQARDEYADRCEEAVDRRAFWGVERPVFQGGVLVGHTVEYSDKLAEVRLRSMRRSAYSDQPPGQGAPRASFIVSLGITTRDGDPRPPATRRPVLDVSAVCLPAADSADSAPPLPEARPAAPPAAHQDVSPPPPAAARPRPAPGSALGRAVGPPAEGKAPPLSLHPNGAPVGPPHTLFLGTNGSPLEVGGWIEGIEVEGGGEP